MYSCVSDKIIEIIIFTNKILIQNKIYLSIFSYEYQTESKLHILCKYVGIYNILVPNQNIQLIF